MKYKNDAQLKLARENVIATARQIEIDNERFAKGEIGIEQAVYDHARFSLEEYRARKTGMNFNNDHKRIKRQVDVSTCSNAPASINWVTSNKLSPVQQQGECGCCYIFAGIATLESAYAIKYNKPPVKLSEEYMLECLTNTSGIKPGCGGGFSESVWDMTIKTSPQGAVASSKYTAYNQIPLQTYGACVANAAREPNTTVDHWITIPKGDEETIKCYLAKYGPMSIVMDFDGKIKNYQSGVFQDLDRECSDAKIYNHAVVLVGYGSELNSSNVMADYWLIRNSWGPNWGLNGYFKVARNRNVCHVSTLAQLPVLPDVPQTKTAIDTSICQRTQDFYDGAKYLKSSCLINTGGSTYTNADAYCKSKGMQLFKIDSILQTAFFTYAKNLFVGNFRLWVNGGTTCSAINGLSGVISVITDNCANLMASFCEYVGKGKFYVILN